MKQYGDIELGIGSCSGFILWHQTITWTNIDSSSMKSSDNDLRAISQIDASMIKISSKISYLKSY